MTLDKESYKIGRKVGWLYGIVTTSGIIGLGYLGMKAWYEFVAVWILSQFR